MRITVDRIDGTRGYEPGNVQWATYAAQARNRRDNVYLEYEGRRRLLVEWAVDTGIPCNVLHYRLRAGWSAERVLAPRGGRHR